MNTYRTRICPGCGRLVVLPVGHGAEGDVPEECRPDALAHSLCGCWVDDLSDSGLRDLVRAILSPNGDSCHGQIAAGGEK